MKIVFVYRYYYRRQNLPVHNRDDSFSSKYRRGFTKRYSTARLRNIPRYFLGSMECIPNAAFLYGRGSVCGKAASGKAVRPTEKRRTAAGKLSIMSIGLRKFSFPRHLAFGLYLAHLSPRLASPRPLSVSWHGAARSIFLSTLPRFKLKIK